MHARYEPSNGKPTLSFERRLAHPVDTVWTAITASDELAHWFPCAVDVDLRAGGEMKFTFAHDFPDFPTTLEGRVTEFDPPHLFAFYWGNDHLRFELEPADGGAACVLRFTVLLEAADKAARDAAGWHVCLDRLEERLTGKPTTAPDTEPTNEWDAHYEEYQRRGLPATAPIPGRS